MAEAGVVDAAVKPNVLLRMGAPEPFLFVASPHAVAVVEPFFPLAVFVVDHPVVGPVGVAAPVLLGQGSGMPGRRVKWIPAAVTVPVPRDKQIRLFGGNGDGIILGPA
jgi:hypothetical protein